PSGRFARPPPLLQPAPAAAPPPAPRAPPLPPGLPAAVLARAAAPPPRPLPRARAASPAPLAARGFRPDPRWVSENPGPRPGWAAGPGEERKRAGDKPCPPKRISHANVAVYRTETIFLRSPPS